MSAAEKPARRRTYMPAAQRRAQIIEAAQGVFAHANLKGARTRDIARAAAVNQATIFEHFASKEALFEEAVIQPLIAAMRGMHGRKEVYETAAGPEEMAALARASSERHLEDMDRVFPLLAAALFSDPDLGRALYREHIAPLLRARGAILKGLTREGLALDFVGLAIFGMQMAVALDRHFGAGELTGGTGDLTAVAEQFTRMATGGFARHKPEEDGA
ncbi:TetR/AcrR family transcriptional regulator [Novosphingobium soli]|uniref:TetR/AcrR family transcriptional regulator n=1 Tax=Novosphingobium soli TaxID=574956 RepID=A0ABV6D173_9SPHN